MYCKENGRLQSQTECEILKSIEKIIIYCQDIDTYVILNM